MFSLKSTYRYFSPYTHWYHQEFFDFPELSYHHLHPPYLRQHALRSLSIKNINSNICINKNNNISKVVTNQYCWTVVFYWLWYDKKYVFIQIPKINSVVIWLMILSVLRLFYKRFVLFSSCFNFNILFYFCFLVFPIIMDNCQNSIFLIGARFLML